MAGLGNILGGVLGANMQASLAAKNYLKENALFGAFADPQEQPQNLTPEQQRQVIAERSLDMVPGIAGITAGRRAMLEAGLDPAKHLFGQFSGLWDKQARAVLDPRRAVYKPDTSKLTMYGNEIYGGKLSDLYQGDDIYKLMPDAKNINIKFLPKEGEALGGGTGAFSPKANVIALSDEFDPVIARRQARQSTDKWVEEMRKQGEKVSKKDIELEFDSQYKAAMANARSTLDHEINHWVQFQEGMDRGGSPSQFMDTVNKTVQDAKQVVSYLERTAEKTKLSKHQQKRLDRANALVKSMKTNDDRMEAAWKLYRRLTGEIEARYAGDRGRHAASIAGDVDRDPVHLGKIFEKRHGQPVEAGGVNFLAGKPFPTSFLDPTIPLKEMVRPDVQENLSTLLYDDAMKAYQKSHKK